MLCDILDRLSTCLLSSRVPRGSAREVALGRFVEQSLWSTVSQIMEHCVNDPRLVEKCCRVLKHSVRTVPDAFKPLIPRLVERLITDFNKQHHSSYLYMAEVLAGTYGSDPEVEPLLSQLFVSLSGTALQALIQFRATNPGKLDDACELIEDFYGMCLRYLRHCPHIVVSRCPEVVPFMSQLPCYEPPPRRLRQPLLISLGNRPCSSNRRMLLMPFSPSLMHATPPQRRPMPGDSHQLMPRRLEGSSRLAQVSWSSRCSH